MERRALVIQHEEIEGPYEIGDALGVRGLVVDARLMGRDELPADLDGVDALVVMGGPVAAYDDKRFPTRRAELALLAQAVERQVPTLGVCLGAQLLAAAAGGAAVPGRAGPEIGWGPVSVDAGDDRLFGGLRGEVTVLHWHGDTVELPPGAALLASSAAYPHQAFRVGPVAWGVQFHIEVTLEAVARFVERFHGEPAILVEADDRLRHLAPVRDLVLGSFADVVATRSGRL